MRATEASSCIPTASNRLKEFAPDSRYAAANPGHSYAPTPSPTATPRVEQPSERRLRNRKLHPLERHSQTHPASAPRQRRRQADTSARERRHRHSRREGVQAAPGMVHGPDHVCAGQRLAAWSHGPAGWTMHGLRLRRSEGVVHMVHMVQPRRVPVHVWRSRSH
jgi:hypothetical protein